MLLRWSVDVCKLDALLLLLLAAECSWVCDAELWYAFKMCSPTLRFFITFASRANNTDGNQCFSV
jgi:hypothetical protein